MNIPPFLRVINGVRVRQIPLTTSDAEYRRALTRAGLEFAYIVDLAQVDRGRVTLKQIERVAQRGENISLRALRGDRWPTGGDAA